MDNNRNAYYWKGKELRTKTAKEHTVEMQNLFAKEIDKCVKDSKIYGENAACVSNEFLDNIALKEQQIKVVPEDSVKAIFNYADGITAVLNFASYKYPGGGFMAGSRAQEECLCHESFLYNVLSSERLQKEFYDWNGKNLNHGLYKDRLIYSPDVIFQRNGEYIKCNVITCAAPNKYVAQNYQNISNEENRIALKARLLWIMKAAAANNVQTLILGAFGCGVFGQDPTEVAEVCKELLDEHKWFNNVIFAIIPSFHEQNLAKFQEILK